VKEDRDYEWAGSQARPRPVHERRRKSTLRRQFNEFAGIRNGHYEESKWWTNAGKATAFYLLLAYGEKLIAHEWALGMLLAALIAPEVIKKAMVLKSQRNGQHSPT